MQHFQFRDSYPAAMTSLRSKILTSYGLSKAALLIFVAVVIADLYFLQTHIVEGEAVNDLHVAIQEIRREEKNLFLYHDPAALLQLQQQLDVAKNALAKGERAFAAIAGSEELLQLERVLDTYSEQLDEYAGLSKAAREGRQDEIRTTGHQLSALTEDIHQRQRGILTRTIGVAARTLIIASVTVILIGLVSALFMVRRVVRPLRQLEKQLDQLAEGKIQSLRQPSRDKEIQSTSFAENYEFEAGE